MDPGFNSRTYLLNKSGTKCRLRWDGYNEEDGAVEDAEKAR